MDHFIPNKDIKSAEHCKCVREFAIRHEISHYYDVGKMGIEHALLPEQGLVTAGDVVIGADSHTCTYGALGAFSTGVGSTDMAAGMASGKAWFKVPSALRFNLAPEVCIREGCHPPYYRNDRCRRSTLQVDGVCRRWCCESFDG